jgi:hypothetical protein
MTEGQQTNPQAVGSDMAVATSDVPEFFHLDTQSQTMVTCSFYKQPTDFSNTQQTFDNKVTCQLIKNSKGPEYYFPFIREYCMVHTLHTL